MSAPTQSVMAKQARKEEYQLSKKYMLSSSDVVRSQVINFTFERFPITYVCAPLLTKHQRRTGKWHRILKCLYHLEKCIDHVLIIKMYLLHVGWLDQQIVNSE